ncbi:MAG: glycosyltransferase family 4 protein, partial [Euryarchaeota archaeon]|nr:glycosyltransferase family 4 protein [Euryarchaeota archaeon]
VLPEPFREALDQFDTVVVPSEQNRELFSRYHDNVRYVPLGIEPDDWHPIARPTLDGPFFNFFISGGGKRKGSDLVIDAFRKVFDTWPDGMPIPRLFVHSAKASEVPNDDRIQLITGLMDPEEERALYAMSHVFVFPSRGEGFGLRPLQAIAQGCPTIATDAHGHKAFSHLMTHPLPWSLTETPPQSFHHGPAGSWWEPDFDALCEAMEDAYLNYDRHVAAAAENGRIAVATLNWDETARKYLDAIGRENLDLPDVEPVEWMMPEIRRYLVRVTRSRLMEVGGTQYLMEPGRDYWEPADVKRILFESGVLDFSCLPQNLAGHMSDDGPGAMEDL